MADWTGFRPDSAPAIEGGEKIIAWWKERGRDPRDKLLIFSDGLDVDMIEEAYLHFDGKVRMAFGWGTNLTNDFEHCAPDPNPGLDPISIVIKVSEANGLSGGQALGQSGQGHRHSGRNRPLSADFRG